MPRPDGVLLTKLIRRHERHHPQLAASQIVLCSADVQEFTRLPLQQLNVPHCLTKPILLEDIRQLLPTNRSVFQDIGERLALTGNHDPKFIEKLRETLLRTLREDQLRAAQAYAEQDRETLKDAAHRMKGSLLILGYQRPAEAFQAVIGACQQGKTATEAYTTMHQLLQDLLQQLDRQVTPAAENRQIIT